MYLIFSAIFFSLYFQKFCFIFACSLQFTCQTQYEMTEHLFLHILSIASSTYLWTYVILPRRNKLQSGVNNVVHCCPVGQKLKKGSRTLDRVNKNIPADCWEVSSTSTIQPRFCPFNCTLKEYLLCDDVKANGAHTKILEISIKKTNSVALCPRANYTYWATATCRRNLVPNIVDRGVSRGQRRESPTVVNLSFLDRFFQVAPHLSSQWLSGRRSRPTATQ
jgi:hypothetical protein